MKRAFILSAAIALAVFSASARQPERGYRGFVDWSNRYSRHSDQYGGYTQYYTGIATSHGYQFNPWLFAGAGIDVEVDPQFIPYLDFLDYTLSLFVEGRTDLKFGPFTPFADVRIGYNANSYENGNLYFSPSIGYRINWGRRIGLNVGIGYTLDRSRYEEHVPGITPDGFHIMIPTGVYHQYNQSYLSFRIGIDF